MQRKTWKQELLTIPNLLSIFRILLIPVYLHVYLNARTPDDYCLAAVIMAVSCFTDLIDGKIARAFNMITNVGKVLDPLADKLTQLAMLIALSARRKCIQLLLVLFLIKEFFQLFAMIGSLRRGKALNGALMSGKISTTVLFTSLILMVMIPGMSEAATNGIAGICLVFLLFAFADYIRAYFGKDKKIYDLE